MMKVDPISAVIWVAGPPALLFLLGAFISKYTNDFDYIRYFTISAIFYFAAGCWVLWSCNNGFSNRTEAIIREYSKRPKNEGSNIKLGEDAEVVLRNPN